MSRLWYKLGKNSLAGKIKRLAQLKVAAPELAVDLEPSEELEEALEDEMAWKILDWASKDVVEGPPPSVDYKKFIAAIKANKLVIDDSEIEKYLEEMSEEEEEE